MRLAYRLLANLGLLLTSTLAVFALVETSRGGLRNVYLHSAPAGAGQPFFLQYFSWIFRVLQGDLGWSTLNAEPVAQAIADRLPVSIELAFFGFVTSVVAGAAIGYGRARARGSPWRGVLAVLQVTGRAIPVVVLALSLQLLTIFIPWLAMAGMSSGGAFDPLDLLRHLILPVLSLAVPFGSWSSLLFYGLFRATEDGVRISAGSILERVATTSALFVPAFLAVDLIVERDFAWHGMGQLFLNGIQLFDFGAVAGCLLVYSLAIVLIKVCADLLLLIPSKTVPRQIDTAQRSATRSKPFSTIGIIALVVLLCAAIGAVAANLISPAGPDVIDQAHWQGYPLSPGVAGHVLGTDEIGRDLLSRLLFGLRTSLVIAALAAAIAAAIGAVVAMATKTMPLFDGLNAAVATGIRPFAAFPFMLATVMVLADRDRSTAFLTPAFVVAMIVVASWRAIIPASRALTPATIGCVIDLTACSLLLEVTLSSMGFGVQPPGPSLGNMLMNAQSDLAVAPWAALVPIVVIIVTLFALYAVADDLRERDASP